MKTSGRILQCIEVGATKEFSRLSGKRRRELPLLPLPRRIRHTVHLVGWLFLIGTTGAVVPPVRGQTAPEGVGVDLASFPGSPAPAASGTSSAGSGDASRGDATAPRLRSKPEPVVADANAPLHGITITASRDTTTRVWRICVWCWSAKRLVRN